MRVGQNPAKSIDHVPQPERVTVAIVSYIPFLHGYYAGSMEVFQACLNSLWENTSLQYDLIVFDNASCQPVRDFLQAEHAEGRIQYLVLSDRNVGKGGAWNVIFGGAPGEIIAYADADVLFRPGWLEKSLDIIDAYPKIGMVTARPLRTPEAFYTSTLEWAQSAAGVRIENDTYISWETYLEHVLSLGTEEGQAREWYNSRVDTRLTYRGIQAYPGAAHFQFCARKSVLQEFLPFQMDRPMGQVRSLDERINGAGYLRLTTTEALVKHQGNQLNQAGEVITSTAVLNRTPSAQGIFKLPLVKKVLMRLYDKIFKIYYQ